MTEETLFAQALQKPNPAERAAFLDEACAGDAALRARVEDLLKAHAAAGNFLEHPVPDAGGTSAYEQAAGTTPASTPAESAGMRIGPYKLLQKLGEGGMGAVWLAEQSVPVQRRVALKLIKAGMDSAHVLARFEAERQALALMDHPHIARVFDAGASDGGRPYFVMELVKGVPITKFCDQERLSPRERLELFIPVCQAVQHAHQKGIIHRDLKPSNVLIALYDGKPVPKVIDFGVAKATSQKLTEQSLFTEIGAIVGTLEYMAPEQAELNNLDIDTRADIYSLGVLLYELLTGSPPFSSKQLRSAAFTEMLRMIREVEPQKPSTKLSSSEELPSIAAKRKLEPKRLSKLVQGDLDWIVMKCLEKERSRRYETANGLAVEIQRYLADEPVLAGPPSARYRLRKFVRRHRGFVLAAGVVLLALLGGVTGTTVGLVQAERARQAEAEQRGIAEARELEAQQAAAAERQAKVTAQLAETAERTAKQLSQQRLGQIEKANDILAKIFQDLDPRAEEKGGPTLRVQLGEQLEKAAQALEGEAVGDPLAVARLQAQLGVTLMGLGYAQRAIEVFAKARTTIAQQQGPDHADTLAILDNLAQAYTETGRLTEAIQLLEAALPADKTRLGLDDPSKLRSLNTLARAYQDAGRLAEAIKIYEEILPATRAKLGTDDIGTLTTMDNLAQAYHADGRLAESIKLHEEVLPAMKAKLGPRHATTLLSMHNLAGAYRIAARRTEAISLYQEVLPAWKAQLGPNHPNTLACLNGLALVYEEAGRLAEAIPLFEELLPAIKKKLGPDHPKTLTIMNNLASAYYATGQQAKAIQVFEEVLPVLKARLGLQHPATLAGMDNLAAAYLAVDRLAEAIKLFEEAQQAWKARRGPDHPDTLISMGNLAVAYERAGRPAEAIKIYKEMLPAQKARRGLDHPDTLTTMNNLAVAYQATGQLPESIQLYEDVLAARKAKLGLDHPHTLASMSSLASAYRASGQLEPALLLCRQAAEGIEKRKFQLKGAGTIVGNLIDCLESSQQYPEAETWRRKWLAVVKEREGPASLACAGELVLLGGNLLAQKKWADAEEVLREALALRQKQAPDVWTTFNTQSMLGSSLLGQKKHAEAEPLLLQGYQGLKEREAKIPPPYKDQRLQDALQRLVQLYEAWDKPDEAAKWKKELEARQPAKENQP